MIIDENKVTITEGDPEHDLWLAGYVNDYPSYEFRAQVFDIGSQYGIDGGRVSKLQVKHDEEEVLNYQKGWSVGDRPRTKTPEQRNVLKLILEGFPDQDRSVQHKLKKVRRTAKEIVSDLRDQRARPRQDVGNDGIRDRERSKSANNPMGFFEKGHRDIDQWHER